MVVGRVAVASNVSGRVVAFVVRGRDDGDPVLCASGEERSHLDPVFVRGRPVRPALPGGEDGVGDSRAEDAGVGTRVVVAVAVVVVVGVVVERSVHPVAMLGTVVVVIRHGPGPVVAASPQMLARRHTPLESARAVA